MATISFRLAEDLVSVEACIHDLSPPIPSEEDFRLLFKSSEFGECLFLENKLPQIINAFPKVKPESEDALKEPDAAAPLEEPLVFAIAQKLDARLEIKITADEMQATVRLLPPGRGQL